MASFVMILGFRIVARTVLARMTAAGRFDTRVAVFGAGEIARRVQDSLKGRVSGVHFVGVYDDRPRDRLDANGLDIKGRLDDLMTAGRNGSIDKIVIALPQSADQRMSTIAARLQQLPVSIHMVTHISSDLVDVGPAHNVSAIGGVGLLDVKGKPLTDWAPIVKRAEDVVLGTLLLAVMLPVMAVIALAIKLESRGPVLFRQRRRGLNLAVIDVLKFRTMRVMEDGPRVEQAREDDPRVTPLGRFLRRTSLDELPQLFNVLKGDMSLVGPRPHALVHDDQWSAQVSAYAVRHQIKPGITGLAQVEGWRGQVMSTDDIAARVAQDVAYIRNWSLGLDLKIIARTFRAVLSGRKAY
jgi:Undecaprenyl-phosphate glucose phosphotransferase